MMDKDGAAADASNQMSADAAHADAAAPHACAAGQPICNGTCVQCASETPHCEASGSYCCGSIQCGPDTTCALCGGIPVACTPQGSIPPRCCGPAVLPDGYTCCDGAACGGANMCKTCIRPGTRPMCLPIGDPTTC